MSEHVEVEDVPDPKDVRRKEQEVNHEKLLNRLEQIHGDVKEDPKEAKQMEYFFFAVAETQRRVRNREKLMVKAIWWVLIVWVVMVSMPILLGDLAGTFPYAFTFLGFLLGVLLTIPSMALLYLATGWAEKQ
jgi:hypothetical protein